MTTTTALPTAVYDDVRALWGVLLVRIRLAHAASPTGLDGSAARSDARPVEWVTAEVPNGPGSQRG
mgnify:CR=1 FL=1